MIEVMKADNGYIARATPPHVTSAWLTEKPLPANAIIAELQKRGAHQNDIRDAFYVADPDWMPPQAQLKLNQCPGANTVTV
jgi:hypothetical protein